MARDDWDAAAEDFLGQQRNSAAVNTVQDRDPDKVARARRMAPYLRAAPALVEAQPEVFDKEVRLDLHRQTIEEYPWMADIFGDPDVAALVGKNELPKIGRVTSYLHLGAEPSQSAAERLTGTPLADALERPVAAPQRRPRERTALERAAEALLEAGNPAMGLVQDITADRERRAQGLPSEANTFTLARHFFSNTVGGLTRAIAGGIAAAADFSGADQEITDLALYETFSTADKMQSYYRPTGGGWAGERAIDAGAMVVDMAAGGGLAGKGLAAYFGVTTTLGSYGKYSQRSDNIGESTAGAVIEGGAEYVFEKGPTALLVNAFGGKYVKGIVAEYIKREMIGELATTAVQYTADVSLADPTEDFEWSTLGQQLLDTAAVVAIGGGVIGGASSQFRSASRAAMDAQDMQRGVMDQAMLDALMEDAADIPLRQNAPDVLARMVEEGAKNSPVRHVYIPAEVIDEVLADETLPEAEREALTVYQSQLDEARAAGGDVVIPIGEAVARFSGTTVWQKLSDEARVQPGGMSGREARENRERIVAELEAAGEAVIAEEETAEPQGGEAQPSVVGVKPASSKQQVYNEVKAQVLKAGRPEKEAQTTAMLLASRMETLASSRYGQFADAMDAWRQSGITIEGPGKPKRGRGKKVVAQPLNTSDVVARETPSDVTQDDVFSSEGDGTGVGVEGERTFEQSSTAFWDWFGDSKVVDKNGAPLVVYHGGEANIEAFASSSWRLREYMMSPRKEEVVNANFFAKDKAVAESHQKRRKGANRLYSVFLKIENPLVIDMKGKKYKSTAEPQEQIEAARVAGHDGVIVENVIDDAQQSGKPTTIYIPFSAEQIKSTANQGTWNPADPRIMHQGPRGATTFAADGSTVVQLFARADFSTMLHEMSHVFLEQEFSAAARPGASDQLKADVATIRKWAAANGHPIPEDGPIPVGAHELFARTGERYFREGKAPSAEFRSAFAQFKEWLTSIYKTVTALKAYGPVPINPEIRAVFDRIIATDEAIAINAATPMSREELAMTEAEYAAYLTSVKTTRDEAHDALLNKMMAAIRRRETLKGQEQRRTIRAEVQAEINAQPGFLALHLLRTGRWLGQPTREETPVKLNTGWLIDTYGEEILDKLPAGFAKVHRGDGVVGDVVAEMTGFPSGDALVQALVGMKAQSDALKAAGETRSLRETVVETAVDKVMADRHGDMGMSETEMREEALTALNSDRQGEVLSTELRQLKKREGKGGLVTPYQLLKEWARRKVAEGRVSEVVSKAALQRYIRGYNKARTAFEEALIAGDVAEATKQKQAQMINHALLAEGKRKADEVGAIVKRLKKLADREAMASVDQDYMDRIHELLAGYNFRAVSQKQLAEQKSFEEWAGEQRKAGNEVYVPPRFRDGRQNWSDTTVEKLAELDNMVASLLHLGKRKQTWLDNQKEREWDELADDSRERILALPERTVPQLSIGEDDKRFGENLRAMQFGRAFRNLVSRHGMRESASELIKIETLFDTADGDKTGTGPLGRLLVNGARDSANRFAELRDEVMQPLVNTYHKIGRKHRAKLNDTVTITELKVNVSIDKADEARIGQPVTVKRMQLIGMLMNTGNLSNLGKMVQGEKWGSAESAVDMTRVRDVLWSYASAEDAALVQALWDSVGKLWPHVARTERAMTGVVPEAVEPMAFATPHGEVRGGYWPVVWDSARSVMGKQQADANDYFGIGIGVSTPVGHTITRTGAAAPMEYGLEQVLFSHLNRVISRVAYAEWVRDALKVTGSGRIMGAMNLRLGKEYSSQIEPWIKDQIPSTAVPPLGSKMLEAVLTKVRLNVSLCALGLSYTTGVAQTLGLAYSAGVVGEGNVKDGMKYMALGFYSLLRHSAAGLGGGANSSRYNPFSGAQEFVFARSEEMRRRMHELNVETADAFRVLRDHDTLLNRGRAMAFRHIAAIDMYMVSMPTWLGAYAKGLDTGMTEEDAAAYAEKAVRLSQGSGRAKDLSAVQRGNAGQKLVAMFYTPGSVFFNQQWDATQHLKAGNYTKAIVPTVWFLAMSTIFDAFREGDWPDDDEDDDGRLDEIAAWASRNMLFGLTFGVPIVRDIGNSVERKIRGEYTEYGQTPLSMLIGGGAEAATTAHALATEDEPVEGRDVKKIAVGVGFVLGIPGVQLGRTGGFLTDVAQGAVEPESAKQWMDGLTYGKITQREEAE